MSGTNQLISAIKSKNIGKMSKLLEKMDLVEVNGKLNGETALHFACRGKYNEAVDLLVAKNGIDVKAKNKRGMTPLHVAICGNNGQAVTKILTNQQVNMNVRDNWGRTPLHHACFYNHHQIVSELLGSPGVDVNVRDRDGITPVMVSARGCREETLKLLLEDTRVDVDAKDEDGVGLREQVGRYWSDSKKKEKCLETINDERRKRENRKLEQEQQSQDGNIGQRNDEVEKLNNEMGELEKRTKANLDIRKQKKRDLKKKHEEEETTMNKRHKDEETRLETTLAREDQVDQRHMALLRKRRDELAQDVQKLNNDPVQDTSGNRGKVEAAQRSLECPVCMEFMRPPTRIWMCKLSHTICESCKDELDKRVDNRGICPTCTTERVNLRALMAENFARTIFNE